jgi:hypothetical protein
MIKEEDDDTETSYKYDQVIKNTINIGAPYMPLPIQLPTQSTTTDGTDTETADYTYTFDSRKRLTSETSLTTSGVVVLKSYTYY